VLLTHTVYAFHDLLLGGKTAGSSQTLCSDNKCCSEHTVQCSDIAADIQLTELQVSDPVECSPQQQMYGGPSLLEMVPRATAEAKASVQGHESPPAATDKLKSNENFWILADPVSEHVVRRLCSANNLQVTAHVAHQ
jgi:hypothetical protein